MATQAWAPPGEDDKVNTHLLGPCALPTLSFLTVSSSLGACCCQVDGSAVVVISPVFTHQSFMNKWACWQGRIVIPI